MSERPMLLIEVSKIPPEGMDVNQPLDDGDIHVAGEESFRLQTGGSLVCRLERGDDETVHVRGHLAASLGLECGRCLAAYPLPVDQDLDLFYLPHRGDAEEEDEVELADRHLVVAYYSGDRLDLGEMLREQFFLCLPMKRLCSEGCLGLCPVCGTNRNITPCECVVEEEPDQRLAVLKKLFDKGTS